MVFVPAPGIAVLEVIYTSNGQKCENTFHYHKGTAWTAAQLTALCDTFLGWVGGNLGFFNGSTGVDKLNARDLTVESGLSVEVTPTDPLVGTDASGVLPNNVTWALKRKTGLAGRANRGRIYMIGLAVDMLTADKQHLKGEIAGDFAAGYDGLLTGQLSANAAQEVILHKALGTGTNVTEYGWSDVTLDSQRRRLPDHNIHH